MPDIMTELNDQIAALLKSSSGDQTVLTKALQLILAAFQSETGTLHVLDRQTQLLHLLAERGLPPAMVDVVKVIPVGKGIAGQVVARGEPVTLCNLQTDASGVAKPGARQTGVGGALCVPVWKGDALAGTLGVGTRRQYEYTKEETQALTELGRIIGGYLNDFRGQPPG
jgi:GAF domain-containing protein